MGLVQMVTQIRFAGTDAYSTENLDMEPWLEDLDKNPTSNTHRHSQRFEININHDTRAAITALCHILYLLSETSVREMDVAVNMECIAWLHSNDSGMHWHLFAQLLAQKAGTLKDRDIPEELQPLIRGTDEERETMERKDCGQEGDTSKFMKGKGKAPMAKIEENVMGVTMVEMPNGKTLYKEKGRWWMAAEEQ